MNVFEGSCEPRYKVSVSGPTASGHQTYEQETSFDAQISYFFA